MTGGDGFLGWHTQCALRESGATIDDMPVGGFFDELQAAGALSGADRLIYLAGVMRGSDDEITNGNAQFAQQVADLVHRVDEPPKTIVFANSTQASCDTVYGRAKARAAVVLRDAAEAVGADFVDVHLPNMFGEHGRPFYNTVTSTFCHVLAGGGHPTVEADEELTLLHAQNAADVLIGRRSPDDLPDMAVHESVSGLLRRLTMIAETYGHGEIPDIGTEFDRDLFNTYRSYVVGSGNVISLHRQRDERGRVAGLLRSHGGTGQSSFSTTRPGVVRGNNFHRRQVERFVVVSGQARISLRRLLTGAAVSVDVDGDRPTAVDMPTMWAHNIRNTGSKSLVTFYWTDDLFENGLPDTISEQV